MLRGRPKGSKNKIKKKSKVEVPVEEKKADEVLETESEESKIVEETAPVL